jgi:branched-chain amino acid transport system substrate-binding protein
MRVASTVANTLAAAVLAGASLNGLGGCIQKKAPAGDPPSADALGAGGRVAAGDTLLLGEVGSLTGQEATFGISTKQGIELALEDINAKGGIKGKKLAVKVYDDQGKPEEAATAATRLIAQDRVAVLLGEVASSRSLAMAPIADANHVPMISTASTNPKVTKDGDQVRKFIFRVCFIDPFQGTVMAKFARENLKLDKVAVLRDVGNDYSVGLADYFVATFKQLGGTIVNDQSYKAGDQDFKAQLTAIRSKSPQGIYVPGYYTDVALIARQARELTMKVPLMGGDGWDSSKLYEIAGGALEGSYFSNHYSVDDPSPRIQQFVKRYKAAYGEPPDALAALGFDSAHIAAAALARAKDFSGPAIRDAIASTVEFAGVTGNITIDENHNARKPAVILKIQGGKGVFASSISP